jgi:hypothetical protein
VVGDRVATRREIIVGSVLILIRASLIALARRLIMIRPRLILITRRLVAITRPLITITRPLITITQRAVTHLINRTRRELGTAVRAPRNLCRFRRRLDTSTTFVITLPFPSERSARYRW